MSLLPGCGGLTIFHIAEAAHWSAALDGGRYRRSTIGQSLDEVGFIHCSRRDQVERVADAYYQGQRGLVLLVIDPARVAAEIRDENTEGGSELFPHIYGPLNLDAVVDVLPLAVGPDGTFIIPA